MFQLGWFELEPSSRRAGEPWNGAHNTTELINSNIMMVIRVMVLEGAQRDLNNASHQAGYLVTR